MAADDDTPTVPPEEERRRSAYHEAGHAAVAKHFRMPIRRVSLVQAGDGGQVDYEPRTFRLAVDEDGDPVNEERLLRALERTYMITLAGAHAQALVAPEHAMDGAEGD